ncbi:MAG: DEAD/DEAH box helicase [Polyangiales bacterium]
MTVRAAPPWFDALSVRAVAERAMTSPDALLQLTFDFAPGSPVLLRDGTLRASLLQAGRPAATLAALPPRVGTAQFEHQCTCGRWGLCPHAQWLLTTLALSDALREALVAGTPLDPALAALPALREAARKALAADRITAQWLPLDAPRPPSAPPEYLLALPLAEPNERSLQSRVAQGDGSVGFEVRVRIPGQKGFLDDAAIRATAFAPDDRRVLRLLDKRGAAKKVLRANGSDAALALHLLRELPFGRAAVDEAGPLAFDQTPLALTVVRTRLPRALLALSLAGREDSLPTLQGRGGGSWDNVAPAGDASPTDALEARWRSDDGAVDLPARETVLYRGAYSFLWAPALRRMFVLPPEVDPDAAWRLQFSPAVELVPDHAEQLWKTLRTRLRGRHVALPSAGAMGLEHCVPLFVLHVEGTPLHLVARTEAQYAFGAVGLSPESPREAASDERRDAELEGAVVASLTAAGFAWEGARDAFTADDDRAVRFWREGAAALRERNDPTVSVLIPASLGGVTVREAVTARLRLSRSGSLLDLALALDAGGRKVDLDAARAALARKRRWVELDDRSLAEITDELADLLEDTAGVIPEGATEGRVPLHQWGRVERWAAAAEFERDQSAEAMRARLRSLAVAAAPELPSGLRAMLRPYQLQGLAWLQFLDGLGAGGVLADDMGLGKTVMTLALLQWRRERDGGAPSLVVCPTSVAGNWAREAARFTPGLRVVSLHGASAAARATTEFAGADLVITTYALLRRDVERLRETAFRVVVLDEAQTIKNLDAATTRAARALRASTRLALSGTPVENRLTELWSVMDFCNPGMLGTSRQFEDRFEKPLARAALDGPASPKVASAAVVGARLRALIRPFVLRRTRAEVLDDLPPRQEVELACPLGDAHRTMYDALAVVLREEVKEFARRDPFGRPGVAVFTALLRLRQMACDPRLVDGRTEVSGSKRETFLATARALAAEGRRALVFSQFVELLGLWGADLAREGIAYEYLDGSTVDRDGVVRRFQEGAAPLFLISLKAGGAGLNLTAADTVIHCDPWWNPAVEDQATARAHRMGQTRGVTVYRLVARGTVEERVLALKRRKQQLADAVIHGDGGAALAGITAEDVAALLADADEGDAPVEEPW